MRVACLNQDPGISPGRQKGAAVHLDAMRTAFRELGAEVVAVDQSDEGKLLAALDAAWSEAPFAMIYERYALARGAGARFARDKGVPYVLEVNAPLADEEQRYRAGANLGEDGEDALPFRTAALAIAVSSQVAEYAVERGASPEAVRVFPNGVDTGRFRPRAADDELRAKLVPAGRLALGFHGRLRPWHGFPRLVDIVERLVARGLPLHLVLVGVGDFEEALEGRLPPDRYSRVPWVEHADVGRYVATFDLLPITYAPDVPCYFSPLKLAEAMACGVVPIVPRLGDLTQVVEHGRNGLVYSAERLDELAEHVERLHRQPEERARLAAGAVAKAESLSWKSIAAVALSHAAGATER